MSFGDAVPWIARTALALVAAREWRRADSRWHRRDRMYGEASDRARETGRRLVVVGAPHAGLHTRIVPAYGCGDLCVDIQGCNECPASVQVDLDRQQVPGVADNSAVVFCSCVLEYVQDPVASWRELMRMAGSRENLYLVTVDPVSLTALFYPGARWVVLDDGAAQPHFLSVSAITKGSVGGAIGVLGALALKRGSP